ncbi:MAG: DoxX family protein [Pyrinomonadaceae bacterium]
MRMKIPGKDSRRTWALLPLRLIIGFGFMAHGYAKLSKGPEEFAHILQAIGVPAPSLAAWTTTLVELFGGLAVLAGVFIPIVSIPLVIVMLVALFTVHLPYGFSTIKLMAMTANGAQFGPPGYELNLLYIAGLLALVLGGASPFSVDGWLVRRKKRV